MILNTTIAYCFNDFPFLTFEDKRCCYPPALNLLPPVICNLERYSVSLFLNLSIKKLKFI
jgi:hypothetical protein